MTNRCEGIQDNLFLFNYSKGDLQWVPGRPPLNDQRTSLSNHIKEKYKINYICNGLIFSHIRMKYYMKRFAIFFFKFLI